MHSALSFQLAPLSSPPGSANNINDLHFEDLPVSRPCPVEILPATQVEGASWRIDHVQLPALGNWHVRVEILVSDFEKITLEDKIGFSR
jgi:hypothetical protein